MVQATGDVFFDGTLARPQLDHPECVAVHPDGSIWCGGEQGQIYRIEADGSAMTQVASTEGFVLGIAFGPADDLFACDLRHRAVFRLDLQTSELTMFSDGGARPFVTPNFPVVTALGDVYVSDSNAQGEPGGGVYRFDSRGRGGLWFDGPLNFANGMALAPAGDRLYVVETFRPGITAIAITGDGTAGEVTSVVDFSSAVGFENVLPDGVAVGPDGMLYVGCYEPSRVLRVDPFTADVTDVLADPTAHLLCHPTNVAFRGAELFTANLGRWHVTRILGATGE